MTNTNNIKDRYEKFIESCEILERDIKYRNSILIIQNDFYKEMFDAKTLAVQVLDKYEKKYSELVNSVRGVN